MSISFIVNAETEGWADISICMIQLPSFLLALQLYVDIGPLHDPSPHVPVPSSYTEDSETFSTLSSRLTLSLQACLRLRAWRSWFLTRRCLVCADEVS
jgi:hypothetical protein